ncbi:DnaJ-like protein [Striga asiatica]|uniref:DnaJ-like protein n=1 Tax=Striga asiatica TaxID=4170 RepID=A0A5A7P1B2_STRAF|nr:DnaJ-like protein [Striga asiatica]
MLLRIVGVEEEQVAFVREIQRKRDYYDILGYKGALLSKQFARRTKSIYESPSGHESSNGCPEAFVLVSTAFQCLSNEKKEKGISTGNPPDKNQAPGAQEAFVLISKAFQCLSNEKKRKKYDVLGTDVDSIQDVDEDEILKMEGGGSRAPARAVRDGGDVPMAGVAKHSGPDTGSPHTGGEGYGVYGPWLVAKTNCRQATWQKQGGSFQDKPRNGTKEGSGSRFGVLREENEETAVSCCFGLPGGSWGQ